MNSIAKLSQRIKKSAKYRIGLARDYMKFATLARPYRAVLSSLPPANQGGLLIVSGRGMNIVWAQLWPILSLPLRQRGYKAYVLTTHKQRMLNRYYTLLGLTLLFLDDGQVDNMIPAELQGAVKAANTLDAYRALFYRSAPVGQIALSTYSRHIGTGLIDFNDEKVIAYINDWLGRICGHMSFAERLYEEHQIKMVFCTEVFMEEYGAFYYEALNAELNIIRFAGTVRDNAFIMQHLSRANDRIHHASIAKSTWDAITRAGHTPEIEQQLMQNFADRYSAKWHKSKRNHADTQIIDVEDAKARLDIAPGRKVAVVYSHILYDTLFFFGTDLFGDYAQWLVETTRAAIANPHLDWLIKVHPSNLWRGEMDSLLKGKYEEERLLEREFGTLPAHVRIVGADTPINPFTWFQLADYGITVRGTSGLEMAALGKTVVTAGTGRYEGNGFTTDCATAAEYLDTLSRLHTLPAPSDAQQKLAQLYAHAIFMRKPFALSSFIPTLRAGCKQVYASDDLIYMPGPLENGHLGTDLQRFADWALKPQELDLLSGLSLPEEALERSA